MNTKKYIEATLKDFLKKRSIDKIKVNEIIREVGTCKGTFYKYYKDKYELLISCFDNYIYDEILSSAYYWDDFVYKCLEKFEKDPLMILNAFDSADVNSLRYYHETLISKYLENNLAACVDDRLNKISSFSIKICAINYTDIILRWLGGGMKESKEELISYMKAAMPQAICTKVSAAV